MSQHSNLFFLVAYFLVYAKHRSAPSLNLSKKCKFIDALSEERLTRKHVLSKKKVRKKSIYKKKFFCVSNVIYSHYSAY